MNEELDLEYHLEQIRHIAEVDLEFNVNIKDEDHRQCLIHHMHEIIKHSEVIIANVELMKLEE